jgi:hypothetical protein
MAEVPRSDITTAAGGTMIDNTTNIQPSWDSAKSTIISYGYIAPHLLIAKSDYDALKAENERLQKRIAELEAQLAQESI